MLKPDKLYTLVTKNLRQGGRQIGSIASRFVKSARSEPAQPPGTLSYSGPGKPEKARIQVIDYDKDHLEQKELEDIACSGSYVQSPTTTWLNVTSVSDVSAVETIGSIFDIHPLVLEDIVHTHQRAKFEDHGHYLYIVLRMLSFSHERGLIDSEQVSLLVGKGWVITFQEKEGDVFDPIRERVKNAQGRMRKFGADYLAYALIDAIIDHYFAVLEKIGDRIEALEELIRKNPDADVLQHIHRLKQEMLFMRKSTWPLRELVSQLIKDEAPLIKKATQPYLRDVYDHTVQILETVESFRDMLSGLQDLYLSMVSHRMNDVMKVLTIIATVFIPPTFIAGVYGMNFDRMPELHTHNGYFIALGIMCASIIIMLVYFRRKKWL